MALNPRTAAAFVHDLLAAAIAWIAAFLLRFNLDIPANYAQMMWSLMVWIVPLQAAIFWAFGLYRGIWRYASVPDVKRIALALVTAALALAFLFLMLRVPVPRSVLILDPIVLMLIMGGSRLAYRSWKEQRVAGLADGRRTPVFVLGATDAAADLLGELARSPDWVVLGVFDDDTKKRGREIHGVRVLGPLAELAERAAAMDVGHAIVAMPDAAHTARRAAVEACNGAGLQAMTVPSFGDLVSGKVTVSQIRHVELDDLLGRDPVALDASGLRGWISGSAVMVTGAGGSIGAELCRQVARFEPRLLIMLEANEFALYGMQQEFTERHPGLDVVYAIGDVRNRARVDEVLARHRPATVLHAAAYKHVPLMEQDNAWQALLNNVAGTHVLARAAQAHGVEKFVLISTDKAVNPTNVMGASKRAAELVCQALQQGAVTRFVMVRFGNVLGSTGSVIPKFREQIARGGPVTVTHPEMRRYFMSIPEATQLVLQAGLMGQGGEIFVLDMGEPVRIADLARDLIRLSGFSEDEIRIVYTGIRPGEKLYEEPLADDESTLATPHPKLRIARARPGERVWLAQVIAWLDGPAPSRFADLRLALQRFVPEYRWEEGPPESASGRDAP